jgi:hypothetical protein
MAEETKKVAAATTAAPAAAAATTTTPVAPVAEHAKGDMKEKFMHYGLPVLVGAGTGFGGMKLAEHFKMNKWVGLGLGFAVGAVGTHFAAKHFTKK